MYFCDMVVLKVWLRRKVTSSIDLKDDCCLKFVYCFIPLLVWKDADTSMHHLVTTLLSVLQNSCYNFLAVKDFLVHKSLIRALDIFCGS